MSATQQAKRRRKQAANNFSHLALQQRPYYKKTNAVASQRRLAQQIERERQIQINKGISKKK